MRKPLESQELENLAILIEEATRSTEEGIKRFIEPTAVRRSLEPMHYHRRRAFQRESARQEGRDHFQRKKQLRR